MVCFSGLHLGTSASLRFKSFSWLRLEAKWPAQEYGLPR